MSRSLTLTKGRTHLPVRIEVNPGLILCWLGLHRWWQPDIYGELPCELERGALPALWKLGWCNRRNCLARIYTEVTPDGH